MFLSDFHSRETSIMRVIGELHPAALFQSHHIVNTDAALFPGQWLSIAGLLDLFSMGLFQMVMFVLELFYCGSEFLRSALLSEVLFQPSFLVSLFLEMSDFHLNLESLLSSSCSIFSFFFQRYFFQLTSCVWNSILASESQKTQTDIIFLTLSKKFPHQHIIH